MCWLSELLYAEEIIKNEWINLSFMEYMKCWVLMYTLFIPLQSAYFIFFLYSINVGFGNTSSFINGDMLARNP